MERNQKDKAGQFDQKQQQQQREKLQGAGKQGVDQEKSRKASEPQKQGTQTGGPGFERDVPRRGSEDQGIQRQTTTNPGRGSDQGMGQSGSPGQPGQSSSPRQTGVGETGRSSGLPGQRSI
jgi:hypothetical protein